MLAFVYGDTIPFGENGPMGEDFHAWIKNRQMAVGIIRWQLAELL